jgi:hypothetical protein
MKPLPLLFALVFGSLVVPQAAEEKTGGGTGIP